MFLFQNKSTISRFVLPCRQLILFHFLGFLNIHYHQVGCHQKAKQMKIITLNYIIDHAKKVTFVFYSKENSFDMIFITVIQPKIQVKWRIFLGVAIILIICLHSHTQLDWNQFVHLNCVFIHAKSCKSFTCSKNFNENYRFAVTLFSSHENVKLQPH